MKDRGEVRAQAAKDNSTAENAADAAALASIEAQVAEGKDPFGDNDETGEPKAEQAAPATTVVETSAADDGVDHDLDASDAAAEVTEEVPGDNVNAAAAEATDDQVKASEPDKPAVAQADQLRPTQFKTSNADEIKTLLAEAQAKKSAAFVKYSDGEMTAEQYMAVDAEVTQAVIRASAETALSNANAQAAANASQDALDKFKAHAKAEALVDYTDPKAAAQFDRAAQMLADDPDNAGMSDAQFFKQAHAQVLAMRSLTPKVVPQQQAVAPSSGKPPARENGKGPITLRQIPAAATPNTGGGLGDQLGRLSGLDFEEHFDRVPKAQRDAYLDS